MREGCSVLREADFWYTIVKAHESQKINACSYRSAAKTTTAQKKKKIPKEVIRKVILERKQYSATRITKELLTLFYDTFSQVEYDRKGH